VKALSLWSFPEILIIQLKRFKQVGLPLVPLTILFTAEIVSK